MLKRAKEIIGTANSRTKGILAAAIVYVVVMIATMSAGAVNQIENFIPTVDIRLKDGVQQEMQYLVKQDTVINVLGELDIQLGENDTLNKDKNDIVRQNDYIKIVRFDTKTIVKEEKIPYSTVHKGSGNWTQTVEKKGKNGIVEKTYLVTYADGKEINRKVIKEKIIKEPVDRVIRHGGIYKGTTFTGRLTTYGGDCNGCGGHSASGVKLSPKTGVNNSHSPYLTYKGKKYYCLAADRSIPFGTVIKISNHNLSVEDTIYGIVVDRGGSIKGNKIDIFKGSEKNGKKFFSGGTSHNTKFEIVSMGSGRANFWR